MPRLVNSLTRACNFRRLARLAVILSSLQLTMQAAAASDSKVLLLEGPKAAAIASNSQPSGAVVAADRANLLFTREELFRKAFSSTAYLVALAGHDPAFFATLDNNERSMMQGISIVSQAARNYEWLKENKVSMPADASPGYGFMGNNDGGKSERAFWINVEMHTPLAFSNDQSRFRLNENEPVRSAMTQDAINEPIYINSEIINKPGLNIGFSDAVQILIHEFGHKLGAQKIQSSVDSMAAKVKGYLDSHTTSFKTSQGAVKVLKFPDSLYEDWHEVVLQGRFMGVNIPNRQERFRAMADEGLYVFVENQSGTFDLSRKLADELKKETHFKPYEGLEYNWKSFYFFNPHSVNVRETEPGIVRIEYDTEIAHGILPFLKPNDIDPEEYRPWVRISERGEYGQRTNHRMEWLWNTSAHPVQLSKWAKPMVFENPEVTAKFQAQAEVNGDLLLRYEIPVQSQVQGSGVVATKPILILTLSGQPIEIEGRRNSDFPTQVIFRIPNIRKYMNGTLKAVSVELEPSARNLAKPYYVRSRIFLDSAFSLMLSNSVKSQAPKLLNIEVWNGAAWVPFEKNSANLVSSAQIRFSFDSTSELNSLQLQLQSDSVRTVTSRTMMGGSTKIDGQGVSRPSRSTTPFTVEQKSMRQQLLDGKLTVVVDFSRTFAMSHVVTNDITPEGLPLPVRNMRMTEELKTDLGPRIAIIGVNAVNQSGLTYERNFTSTYAFDFTPSKPPATFGMHTQFELRPALAIGGAARMTTCQELFQSGGSKL